MARDPSPTFRRMLLAKRLTRMREAAGLTIVEAARQLDKTRSALGRIEKGRTRVDVHFVRSAMDVYDRRDDTLLDLARQSYGTGWWASYGIKDRGYIGMETEAERVRDFQLAYVPGLLQTEDYIAVLLGGNRFPLTAQQADNQLRSRLYRQRRLRDEEFPLTLAAVVDEGALRWPLGGPGVMRAQLRHLIECAAMPTVTLQVLPRSTRGHSGMDGAFTILNFPQGELAFPDVLYIEYSTGALHIDKEEEVADGRLLFDHLRSEALSPQDSIEFMAQVAREL